MAKYELVVDGSRDCDTLDEDAMREWIEAELHPEDSACDEIMALLPGEYVEVESGQGASYLVTRVS